MIRILPRTHHCSVSELATTSKVKQKFVRALAILNLPPDNDEDQPYFNGGMVASLSWHSVLQKELFKEQRTALNRFSYDHGICQRPCNVDEEGQVLPGKYQGKQPYMWRPSKWLDLVDPRLHNRAVRLQKLITATHIEYSRSGQDVAFFYDEKTDDILHVDLTDIPDELRPFENVEPLFTDVKPEKHVLKLDVVKRRRRSSLFWLLVVAIFLATQILWPDPFERTQGKKNPPKADFIVPIGGKDID